MSKLSKFITGAAIVAAMSGAAKAGDSWTVDLYGGANFNHTRYSEEVSEKLGVDGQITTTTLNPSISATAAWLPTERQVFSANGSMSWQEIDHYPNSSINFNVGAGYKILTKKGTPFMTTTAGVTLPTNGKRPFEFNADASFHIIGR